MIPKVVRQFIFERIDSIAHIEALLLLFRAREERWSVVSVAKRLYITEQEASDLLNRLQTQGFVIKINESFQFHCEENEFVDLLNIVADVYTKHLISVTNLIHAKPSARIREFADAFKLRKDR